MVLSHSSAPICSSQTVYYETSFRKPMPLKLVREMEASAWLNLAKWKRPVFFERNLTRSTPVLYFRFVNAATVSWVTSKLEFTCFVWSNSSNMLSRCVTQFHTLSILFAFVSCFSLRQPSSKWKGCSLGYIGFTYLLHSFRSQSNM